MTVRQDQLPSGTTLREIAEACGGWAGTGRLCGVTAQSVIKWKKVPDRHVDAIVRASGFPLWMIRPDLAALRSKRVHKPAVSRKPAAKKTSVKRTTKGRK